MCHSRLSNSVPDVLHGDGGLFVSILFLHVTQEIRQGYPLSVLLFVIIVVENMVVIYR